MRLRISRVVLPALLLASALAAQAKPPKPITDPFVGSFGDGTGVLTIRKERSGYAGTFDFQGQRYPVSAAKTGERMIGTFVANGDSYMFTAAPSGGGLAVMLNGQTYQLSRQDGADRAPGAASLGAGQNAEGGSAAQSAQDRQLAQLLLSSPWCSFSYKSGYTHTSRNVFYPNGTLATSTNSEGGTVNQYGGGNVDVGGGATGSVHGQSQGGGQLRWKVQGGQLYLDQGSGFQAIAIRITRNSNGYPIITSLSDGAEYSQCK
jgi:hypothetical protein